MVLELSFAFRLGFFLGATFGFAAGVSTMCLAFWVNGLGKRR